MDWTAYLKYMQSIYKEFDSLAMPNEEILIRYFSNKFRLSIQGPLDERDH